MIDTTELGTVAIVALRSQLDVIQNLQLEAEHAAAEAGGRLVGHGCVVDADEAAELHGRTLPAGVVMVKWQMARAV